MKITIEVITDDRQDAIQLFGDALRKVRQGRAVSKETVHSCLGDWTVTIEDEETPPVPYKPGDLVTCIERGSAYQGHVGEVQHSGPGATGVRWRGWEGRDAECIKDNSVLRPYSPSDSQDAPRTNAARNK